MNIFDIIPKVWQTDEILRQQRQQKTQVAPTSQSKGATNFFVDEQSAYNRMIQDWLSDGKARELITQNRQSMLKDITEQEKQALLKMQKDWLDSKKAVELVKKNRQQNLPAYKKALKFAFDASVWATWMATKQLGNIFGFLWNEELQRQGREAVWVAERISWWTAWATFWKWVLWAWEMFAVSPAKVAPTLLGRTWQAAVAWGVIWAWEEITSKWSEATLWSVAKSAATDAAIFAAATPLIEKVAIPAIWALAKTWVAAVKWTAAKTVKYWEAAIKWGTKWLKKSVIRDVTRPFWKEIGQAKAATLSTKANRFNATDIEKFSKITWETPWEFAVNRGMTKVWDEAYDEAVKNFQKSYKEADDALKLIDGTFKTSKWKIDYIWEMLWDLTQRLKNTISPEARKSELLLKKLQTQWLTMSEINTVKRLYSQNFKYTWADAASESALRSTNLQNWLRKWQFDIAKKEWLSNLKDINKTTQWWKAFSDSLGKKLKRSSWNNNVTITDYIGLSGWEPTNLALYLGKKIGSSAKVQQKLISWLSKAKKAPIVSANRESILKANAKKEAAQVDKILKDTISGKKSPITAKPTPKALPAPKIVTPQTQKRADKIIKTRATKADKKQEKKIIEESKQELKRTKFGKGWYIAPQAILDDIAKLGKKLTSIEKDKIAQNIVKNLWIAEQYSKQALKIVKDYIKKYWAELKNKLWELFDELADKFGVRSKFMQDTWKSLDDFGNMPKELQALSNKVKDMEEPIFFMKNKSWWIRFKVTLDEIKSNLAKMKEKWLSADKIKEKIWEYDVIPKDYLIPEEVIYDILQSRFIKQEKFIKPNVVYRWVWWSGKAWEWTWTAVFWEWLYTTPQRKLAKPYAWDKWTILTLNSEAVPNNPIVFNDFLQFENWIQYDVAPSLWLTVKEFNKKYPDIWTFIKQMWADWLALWPKSDRYFVKFTNQTWLQ